MTSCVVPGCVSLKSGEKVSLHLFPDPCREPERHLKWVRAILADKVLNKEPEHVFKQLRVCRTHFDDKSFNGICKKLLNTAVPTRNLHKATNHSRTKLMLYETKLKNILRKNSIDIQEDFQLEAVESYEDTHFEEIPIYEKFQIAVEAAEEENAAETYELMEVENPQGEDQFTFVIKQDSERRSSVACAAVKPKTNSTVNQALAPITLRSFHKLRHDFNKCPKKLLAQSICTRLDPMEIAISQSRSELTDNVFQYTVDLQTMLTKESSIERKWDLAALNLMQLPFMKKWNLDKFELSQAYFFYWDKIERSYYFLNNIVESFMIREEMEGRLVSFLLSDPIGDGGQWDMIVSIINKHGVMPKKCFPESFSCESSSRMNAILKSKLREYAKQLRDLLTSGASDSDLQTRVDEQMHEIYNIVGICLGIPPATFTWEFYDKNKKYNSIGPISPLEFYEKHVKSVFNVDDKVCLVTDPRPSNEFGRGYTVDCLGNVVGGRPVFYNNQPVDVLIDLVAKSIKAGEGVWCACDLRNRKTYAKGIEDLEMTNYKLLFDVDVDSCLSKADRLNVGASHASHAVLISGVNFGQNENAICFRVETLNETNKEKISLTMSRQWFIEFAFQIVVDKKFVSEKIMKVFEEEQTTVLPAWDPMGSCVL